MAGGGEAVAGAEVDQELWPPFGVVGGVLARRGERGERGEPLLVRCPAAVVLDQRPGVGVLGDGVGGGVVGLGEPVHDAEPHGVGRQGPRVDERLLLCGEQNGVQGGDQRRR